jgi:hypothetical protein
MTAIYKKPFDRLEIFLDEYQPQLEKAQSSKLKAQKLSMLSKLLKIPILMQKNFPR